MIGLQRRTSQRPRSEGSIREWTSVAIQEWRAVTRRGPWRGSDPRLRRPRTSAQHRRVFASLLERLEDRSVPSGLGMFLSSITSGLQETIVNVAPSLSSPPSDYPVGVVVSAATETVLDAVNPGGATTSPFVLGIGVDVGSQTAGTADSDSAAAEKSSGLSIDVAGVISLSVGLPSLVPGVGDIGTGLVGTVGAIVDPFVEVVAGAPSGGGPGDSGIGISIGGGSGLGGTGTPISNPGMTLTLPGLSVAVSLPLSAPIPSNGGSPVPVPSPVSTLPGLPGGPSGTATPPLSQGGNPVASLPMIPTSPSGSVGATVSPPSEDGSIAALPFAQGSRDSVAPSGATGAPSTGSLPDNPTESGGPANATQSGAIAPNAGPVTIPTAIGPAATDRASSSAAGSPGSVASSGPAAVVGNDASSGLGPLQDAPVLAGPSAVGTERPADREIAPAELLPGDLEGLERALGQLIRGLDGLGEDLAECLTRFGTLEMLLSAGMLVLACEVIRRWDRLRQEANSRGTIGSSRRPGPFYRPKACPFGGRGTRAPAGAPAIA
jgi:hypothetical protein